MDTIELTRSELLEVAHRFAGVAPSELARRVNEAGGTLPYREAALAALDRAVEAARSGPPVASIDALGEAWTARYGDRGQEGWDDPRREAPPLQIVD